MAHRSPEPRPEAGSIRVIDGDSIVADVDGETIELRMLGINASERDECHSDKALDFLVKKIGDAAIDIETVATDQFGRALGYVWHEDEMVNLTLVSNGLAIAQIADGDYPYAAELLEGGKHRLRVGHRDVVGDGVRVGSRAI
jgi:micrococcal nuclease